MEKFNPSWQVETLSQKEQLAKLEQTEGWEKLSKKQRAMILASLSIQRRHDSGRKSFSIRRTRKVVRDWFCHFAVRSLEREEVMEFSQFEKLEAEKEAEGFFGEYFDGIPWQEGICDRGVLEEGGFPQVLYIGKKVDDPGYSENFVWKSHLAAKPQVVGKPL